MTRLWILGAADPEMELIENLLRQAGELVTYATTDGRRVRPGEVATDRPPGQDALILVECALARGGWSVAEIVDHHRPGDPGYGRPPAEFLSASSLGQVIVILARGHLPAWVECGRSRAAVGALFRAPSDGPWAVVTAAGQMLRIPSELVLAAAADHCLRAAYAGLCPGVDPEALGRWRAESRAVFQRRSVEAILADVAAATTAILAAPELWLNGELVADLRGPTGDGHRAKRVHALRQRDAFGHIRLGKTGTLCSSMGPVGPTS